MFNYSYNEYLTAKNTYVDARNGVGIPETLMSYQKEKLKEIHINSAMNICDKIKASGIQFTGTITDIKEESYSTYKYSEFLGYLEPSYSIFIIYINDDETGNDVKCEYIARNFIERFVQKRVINSLLLHSRVICTGFPTFENHPGSYISYQSTNITVLLEEIKTFD